MTSDDIVLDMNHQDVMPVNYIPNRRQGSPGDRPILIVKMRKGQVSQLPGSYIFSPFAHGLHMFDASYGA